MTKVIAFINRKGGTGKTTNAINVATTLAQSGKRVVLIETDINFTLNNIRKKEMERAERMNGKAAKIIRSEETSVVKEIRNHQKQGDCDFVIVDSAGNTSEYGTNRLCVNSDLVVIPSSLSRNDLMVAEQTMEYLQAAIRENPEVKVVILPTRIHSRSKIENVQQAFKHLNVQVLDSFVPARKIYTEVSTVDPVEGYEEIVKKIVKLLK